MNLRIWDILAILFLLAAIAAGVVIGLIYSNPYSSLNPFPPPTLPALLVLPTQTYTPQYRLPATWTPTREPGIVVTNTLVPSATALPSSTSFLVPTTTDTATPTNTVTRTPTITRTPTASRTPTRTFTPRPTATITPTETPIASDTPPSSPPYP